MRVLIKPRAQLCDQRLELGDPLALLGNQRIALSQSALQLDIRLTR